MLCTGRNLLGSLLTCVLGCSSGPASSPPALISPPPVVAPAPPTLDLATASRECTMLIGTINAGINHVTEVGQAADAAGQDGFVESAEALERVASAVLEQRFVTPDLLRLGGFFVGIAKQQAVIFREIAATPDGDEAKLGDAQTRLKMLYQQEDAVLSELNLLCRGEALPASPSPAP